MIIEFQCSIVFPIEAKAFDLNAQHRWEFLDTQSFDGGSFLLTFLTKVLVIRKHKNGFVHTSPRNNKVFSYGIVSIEQFPFDELIQ